MLEKKLVIMNDLPPYSGIGQYSLDLAKVLASEGFAIDYVSLDCSNETPPNLRTFCVPDPFKNLRFKSNLYVLTNYNLLAFRRLLRGYVHITSQFLIPLGQGREKVAVTVHDLNQLHMTGPDIFSTCYTAMKFGSLRKYRFIVTVSNFVKQDILEHFRVEEESVYVQYNWIDASSIVTSVEKRDRSENGKIRIIHVGNDLPNKNINLIYRLLKVLPNNYELIRVGSNSARNMMFVKRNSLEKRVSFYHLLSPKKLNDLYNTADLFLFPSYYEGFGRPLLEAMAHGLPVVYRNSSSLPEIAGDAGLRFSSDELSEIGELIEKAADLDSRKILRKKSLERSALFELNNQRRNILRFYDSFD